MKDDLEILVNDAAPHVDVLVQEFKQAGVMPNGFYDIAFNQELRRMIWAGQSPDGRKWDENMPEGQPARPWNGSSDTRIPMVDSVCNDDTALLATAFDKAELRAHAVNVDQMDNAAGVSTYLHWMVHTKYRRALKLERELSAQYSREHGWCVAYIGWERELGKRRVEWTAEEVAKYVEILASGGGLQSMSPGAAPAAPGGGEDEEAGEMPGQSDEVESQPAPAPSAPELPNDLTLAQQAMLVLLDPDQEAAAVEILREVYRAYVMEELNGKGYYSDELTEDKLLNLKAASARKALRDLREHGKAMVPMPYVCKNQPLVWVMQPYLEVLVARGTMMLQQARAVFWRRWMTEAELEGKAVEGWDPDWIEEVKKTKGHIASWAGALGATSLTGPSTKTVGNTTYLKITEENNPLIEVIYGFVKKVDEDGVTGIYETIFSPHVTRTPDGATDFCAKHELLDYAHGRYPFVELKRENIGRALIDTRSVAEICGTWQNEEKQQRDMLFNRAQWDTLPPVSVPQLGGVDYRLGPGAVVPMRRNDTISAINLHSPSPQLALELIQLLKQQKDDYFGQFNPAVDPAKIGAKQGKNTSDFYDFWGEIFLHMFALTLQYNPQEIARVTGSPELLQLDAFEVMDQFSMGLGFDVQELNPDYLFKKLEAIHERILPADAGGVVDRAALTNLELRMLDPRLAQKVVMEKGQAAQQVYRDVDAQVGRMALGNEAEYSANDPAAQMKLQFLGQVIQSNPKYQKWLKEDQDFQKLLRNYQQNLEMSVKQEENKQVGRLGVKPMTAAPQAA